MGIVESIVFGILLLENDARELETVFYIYILKRLVLWD